MMVLEHSTVVVKDSKIAAGVGQKLVAEAGVVHVVNSARVERGKHFQIGEYLLN